MVLRNKLDCLEGLPQLPEARLYTNTLPANVLAHTPANYRGHIRIDASCAPTEVNPLASRVDACTERLRVELNRHPGRSSAGWRAPSSWRRVVRQSLDLVCVHRGMP
jgi:hypothetical protein